MREAAAITALGRQDLLCMYLIYHDAESIDA